MLIDLGSPTNILFWSTFEGLQIDHQNIGSCKGYLIGLSGKQVLVKSYITLETTLGSEVSVRAIKVMYLVVDAMPL